jgi:hypothetical protein
VLDWDQRSDGLILKRAGESVALYMADCFVPGTSLEQLLALQRSLIALSQRSLTAGKPVHYLRTLFVEPDAHWMCLFETANPKFVQEVSEAAQLPFTRIIQVIEFAP